MSPNDVANSSLGVSPVRPELAEKRHGYDSGGVEKATAILRSISRRSRLAQAISQ